MNKFGDCTNKIAVVTGGAGLIGKSLCEGLAQAGATILVADISIENAETITSVLLDKGYQAHAAKLDITNENSIGECIGSIVAKHKKIDIWVNSAYPKTPDWGKKFEDIPAESWRKNIDMHLNGYCFCCQKVAACMKQQGFGSIINIASIYGIIAPDFSLYEGTSMTSPAAYSVIKGGIVNFTKYLASYFGPFGVRVNSISPGGVFDNQVDSFVDRYTQKTPLRRMATPDDIVGAAVFFGSDSSAYITGHNLVVDGGISIV